MCAHGGVGPRRNHDAAGERLGSGWSRPSAHPRRARLRLDEVKAILREGQTAFVVADVGEPLVWVEGDDVFPFWKAEVSSRLADPTRPAHLEDFPDGYCYFAESWKGPDGHVVVLAKSH